MLRIDGSIGEGGGQILRSALSLSMVTGQSFRIERIRANRDKPGLRPQHLTAVNAAAEVCGAKVSGAAVNSTDLTFESGPVKPGDYHFAIGTAGSTTLVFQTILPALLCAVSGSNLVIEGGTHNPFAPPVDFLERAFLPLIRRMGPDVCIEIERPGFYPKGGGRFRAAIHPVAKLTRLDLPERGAVLRKLARAVVLGLPRHIAEREISTIEDRTGWPHASLEVQELPRPLSPGNFITIEIESEHVTEVFSGIGERGVLAESIAERTVESALRYLRARVPVGDCLADQLLLPMALAGGGSFKTLPLTLHSQTNIQVIQSFLDIDVLAKPISEQVVMVHVGG